MATFLPFEISPILVLVPAIMAIREEDSELTAQYFGVVLDYERRDYLARSNSPRIIRECLDLIFRPFVFESLKTRSMATWANINDSKSRDKKGKVPPPGQPSRNCQKVGAARVARPKKTNSNTSMSNALG